MKWTDKIATAEVGNIPYGAIFWASLAQALGVLGYAAIQKKWSTYTQLAKWAPTLVGTAGAVLVPQTKGFVGEATAKSMAIGLGNVALAPWIGQLLNAIVSAAGGGTSTARRPAQRKIAGRPNPGSSPPPRHDLNGLAGARELGATV